MPQSGGVLLVQQHNIHKIPKKSKVSSFLIIYVELAFVVLMHFREFKYLVRYTNAWIHVLESVLYLSLNKCTILCHNT